MSDSESDEVNSLSDDNNDDEDDFDDSADEDDQKKKRKQKPAKNEKGKKAGNEKAIKASPKKKAKVEEMTSSSMGANARPKKLSLNNGGSSGNSGQMHAPAAASAPSSSSSSSSSANMKGPPASTPLEARNLVRDYLLQQNRPYSAIQIHDNLHGRVAKPQLQRALDELSAPGPKCCLRVKDYGKAKIYFSDQSLLPAPDANSMRILGDEITNLTEVLREKQEMEAKLKAESSQLSSEPSDTHIDSEIEGLANAVAEKTSRLNRLLELSSTSNTGRVSDLAKERSVAVDTFNFYRNAWKTRKEKVVDIVDMVCDGGMGKNRKETMSLLGVETDEDEGVTIPKALQMTAGGAS